MDLIEAADGQATPVDYKRGQPRTADDGSLQAWDTDRVQLGVQALVLRDNGYQCDEAIVYYAKTKQRVRVPVDDALLDQTLQAIAASFRRRGEHSETERLAAADLHQSAAENFRVWPWGKLAIDYDQVAEAVSLFTPSTK